MVRERGKGRSRLTFENTVSEILEEGHVKSMRTPRRACMLMTVEEAEEVCRGRSVCRSVHSDYHARDKAKLSYLIIYTFNKILTCRCLYMETAPKNDKN